MSTTTHDYIKLATYAVNIFASDGKLNAHEFDQLMTIALRDGVVDDDEKRVLTNILNKVRAEEMTDDLQAKITQVREKYNF
ncbi:hypothetical protein [Zooshikella harenae]|uniref:TerB family tellurite resistance protein n=1 Tax=Zooshikella harenae TaxID=2827238 RepID=A0ABS5Z934_9GAMM|nr:hypothetical protein [Zooshikella harenae]MBU2710559.1 hypothetical protein [Zooshikella harenae]